MVRPISVFPITIYQTGGIIHSSRSLPSEKAGAKVPAKVNQSVGKVARTGGQSLSTSQKGIPLVLFYDMFIGSL